MISDVEDIIHTIGTCLKTTTTTTTTTTSAQKQQFGFGNEHQSNNNNEGVVVDEEDDDAIIEKRKLDQEELELAACALDGLVGEGCVDKAIQICLDKKERKVLKFVAKRCGRTCYHVKGEGGKYLCLEGFCSCMSFAQKLTSKNNIVLCKHLVATLIAEETDCCTVNVVADETFSEYMTV